jgi:hypothetical protein
MKRSAALVVLLLMACGSDEDQGSAGAPAPAPGATAAPAAEEPPKHAPSEYFVWGDASAAQGNLDADYADCTAQIQKDPALRNRTKLIEVAAYIQCMAPKGWKFVNPDAPPPQP